MLQQVSRPVLGYDNNGDHVILGTEEVRVRTYTLSGMPMAHKPEDVYVIINKNYFPVITGPLVSDVKWFSGTGETLATFPCGNVRYNITSRSDGVSAEAPPSEVVLAWRNSYFKSGSVKLLSQDYYINESLSYGAWSFSIHATQVAKIAYYIPDDVTIIAPGDGWGVVKRTVKQKVISTDIYRGIDYTEDVVSTLKRIDLLPDKSKCVVVLSYLWGLLKTEERKCVLELTCPVIIVDSIPRIMDFATKGEGVLCRNCDWFPEQGLFTTPEGFHEQSLYYSENLLRLESISTRIQSSAYLYLITHRPFVKRDDRQGTIVCSTLSEYMLVRHEGTSPYLAPIGRKVNNIIDADVYPGVNYATRQVYCTNNRHYYSFIQQNSHWTLENDMLYFCFSMPSYFRVVDANNDFQVRVIETENLETLERLPRLVEITPDVLIWRTKRGIVSWIRSVMTVNLAKHLLEKEAAFSKRGWKRALRVSIDEVSDHHTRDPGGIMDLVYKIEDPFAEEYQSFLNTQTLFFVREVGVAVFSLFDNVEDLCNNYGFYDIFDAAMLVHEALNSENVTSVDQLLEPRTWKEWIELMNGENRWDVV